MGAGPPQEALIDRLPAAGTGAEEGALRRCRRSNTEVAASRLLLGRIILPNLGHLSLSAEPQLGGANKSVSTAPSFPLVHQRRRKASVAGCRDLPAVRRGGPGKSAGIKSSQANRFLRSPGKHATQRSNSTTRSFFYVCEGKKQLSLGRRKTTRCTGVESTLCLSVAARLSAHRGRYWTSPAVHTHLL